MTRPSKYRFTHSMPFPSRAPAVPLPCRAAKGLEWVLPIWFTQCGPVWFTLAMLCSCHAPTMQFFSRPQHSEAVERRVKILWKKYGLEEWYTIAVKQCKLDAAGDTPRFHFARCIFHRDTLALPDLHKFLPTALHNAIKIVSSMKDRPLHIQPHTVNIVWRHAGTSRLTHWGRVTQIYVFNTRLFSLHNTLNYAIYRACLRMVLMTDVCRNMTSLWINL